MNSILRIQSRRAVCTIIGIMLVIMMVMALIFTAPPTSAYAATDPVNLIVKQTFISDSATPVENRFDYRLKVVGTRDPLPIGNVGEGASSYDFIMTGNNNHIIGPFNFERAGIYRFELSQVISIERQGYSYDERVFTIEAHVSPSLSVDFVVFNEDGSKTNNLMFLNEYHLNASDPALMIDPPIVKTVEGNPGHSSTFTFNLVAGESSYPMPLGSKEGIKTVRIVGSGQSEFGTWSYHEAGIYTYTVFEENTKEPGYIYDEEVYTITDTVSEVDGQLVLSRVVTNSMNKRVTSLGFINTYRFGSPVGPIIPNVPGSTGDSPGSPTVGSPGSSPGGSTGSPKGTPYTGDSFNLRLHLALLAFGVVLAAGGAGYLIHSRRRIQA